MDTNTSWPLIVEPVTGDTYYVGDLNKGMALAENDNGSVIVSIGPDGVSVQNDHGWGAGPTFEVAMRFYLGAEFGPIDEHYDATHLRRVLEA